MSSLKPAKRPKVEKKTSKKQKKEGPQRPVNAYVLYLKSARGKVAAANPNAGSGGITKICGAQWKQLSAKERAPFDEEAARDKLRYQREMEQWRKDHPVETKKTAKVKRSGPGTFKENPPKGWTIELDEKRQEHYFWHEETQTSSWTHPVTGKFPDGTEPAEDSQPESVDESGDVADEDTKVEDDEFPMDVDEAAAESSGSVPAAAPSPAPPATTHALS